MLNFKKKNFSFFISKNKIKLSFICKIIDQNRINGSGDFVLQSQKIIKILRAFQKIFFVNLNLNLEKLIITFKTFYPEAEYDAAFFRSLVLTQYPIL